MTIKELLPTDENIKDTFIKDTIGRNVDVLNYVKLLNSIESSCVIALDSYWGSGKTFFVKQIKMILENTNDAICNKPDEQVLNTWNNLFQDRFEMIPQLPIYYDAWANDSDDDPVFSLMYQMLKEFSLLSESKDDIKFKALSKLALEIAEHFCETPILKSLNEIVKLERKDFLEEIKTEKKIDTKIRDFLESIIIERGNRLVIFVDELDRCRPDYAVKLLERIKHYFSCENITFVFSVNLSELQHTIKRYYGNDFDACRYLDRFFDLRLSMPKLNKEKFWNYIGYNDQSYIFDKVMVEVMKEYNMEMREMVRYVRLCQIAAYNPSHEKGKYDFSFPDGQGILFLIDTFVPIMIGMRMQNVTEYQQFVSGKDGKILEKILFTEPCEYYIKHCLLGNNETFEKEPNGELVYVNKKERLQKVYNAVFNYEYKGRRYSENIGKIEIVERSKTRIMDTINLLSIYADFNN